MPRSVLPSFLPASGHSKPESKFFSYLRPVFGSSSLGTKGAVCAPFSHLRDGDSHAGSLLGGALGNNDGKSGRKTGFIRRRSEIVTSL